MTATGFADDTPARLVQRAIGEWTKQLMDVSGNNTLLRFRELKAGTLDLESATSGAQEALLFGEKVRFSDAFGESRADAARRGRSIKARADENFEEKGLETLSVAWGMATWKNPKENSYVPQAPILLCGAILTARGGVAEDFELQLGGDWEINPTLLHVLGSDFEVRVDEDTLLDLLGPEDQAPDGPALFERLSKEAAERVQGFGITPRLVLANFSYARLPMVKDIQNAAELLLDSNLLCAIAGDQISLAALNVEHGSVSPDQPDFTPPADEFLVLDADSSQSYAINSVVAGNNLVIEGPPGTGKSQTIANLIATLSARGKRVLFVAEKRAAIDAVVDRLRKVGLGELVLDLHDGPGAKRKLAQDLKKSLDAAAAARPVDLSSEHANLVHRRDALVARTSALHTKRDPWGISAFEVQAALIAIPESAKSEQRFGAVALDRITAKVHRQLIQELESFVGLGGITIKSSDNPWLPALESGTITSSEQAQQVAEAMVTFINHTLPQSTERLERSLASVGLRRPETVAEWSRALDLLQLTQSTLRLCSVDIFGLDHDALLSGLAPATGGGFGRAWHRLFDGAYKGALREARTASLKVKEDGSVLVNAIEEARSVLTDWRAASTDGGLPRLPEDFDQTRGAQAQLVIELSAIGKALGQHELEELGPDQLAARLRVFIADRQTLNRLPELHRLRSVFNDLGLDRLVNEMQVRNLTTEQAVACLSFVWHSSVLETLELHEPLIGNFDGEAHSRVVSEFRQADREHIETTPVRIKRLVAEHIVAVRDAYSAESTLVSKEANKKTRHIPVRQLFAEAPHVLAALKPCWAMSPLVVPQLLPATQLFDVVIFDEASQVTPESAVGALMRAPQAVVAGDPKQLPPTSFFASGSTLDDEEEEIYEDLDTSGAMTRDFDSILGVMSAILPPVVGTKQLLWHYRSRDERLIAFSNSQPHLYDWSLTTFPGSTSKDVITHELVPFVEGRIGQEDSVSDEVDAVVKAVTRHAREHSTESLGVITMSIKHKNRVDEALRKERRGDRVLDEYMDVLFGENEKFFVKNLERVQGDERDAILLTTGYGKNTEGRMRHTFGPINQEGGERRLNVAVTRARVRMGVISSFSSNDLDPAKLRSVGAQMLRDYLHYVESGGTDLGPRVREDVALNPFERDVRDQLTGAGLQIDCQVGCSGYWIDFAAKDPEQPGRYVLAIEADGARYHSSETARDRDRLRQDHLERLGWRFCRIWSTDWFYHRDREIQRVLNAFSEALHAVDEPQARVVAPSETTNELSNSPGASTAAVRALPKPWRADGRQITEYPDYELVKFMRWIMSDEVPRTTEELVTIGTVELGYKARGHRIVTALETAIATIKAQDEKARRSS